MISWAALMSSHGLSWPELLQLLRHFTLLSLLAVGGAITTAPDMQRYLVAEHGWMNDADFTAGVAIAQAAPGPNILFVAVAGWQVAGPLGVLATMAGIMGPSSGLAWWLGRYRQRQAQSLALRAFTAGLMPLTLGLLLSTGWILLGPSRQHPIALGLAGLTAALSVRTRLSPLWMIAGGALTGALGGL